MMMRARLLVALGAAMMLAALVSGLAGHGAMGFGPMALVFVVARLLARPWLLARGAAALSREMAGQVALVLALFWLGVGIGAVTGWHPVLPVWLPPAAALAAGLVSRLIWKPLPPEFDRFLDEATAALSGMATLPEPEPGHDPQVIADLHSELDALPASGASHYDLVDVLLEAMGRVPVPVFVDTLFDRAQRKTERDLRARVVGLTDPWIADRCMGQRDLDAAFELIAGSGTPNALEAWANGAAALLHSVPGAAIDMPQPARLRSVAATQDADLRAKLEDLARQIAADREAEA